MEIFRQLAAASRWKDAVEELRSDPPGQPLPAITRFAVVDESVLELVDYRQRVVCLQTTGRCTQTNKRTHSPALARIKSFRLFVENGREDRVAVKPNEEADTLVSVHLEQKEVWTGRQKDAPKFWPRFENSVVQPETAADRRSIGGELEETNSNT